MILLQIMRILLVVLLLASSFLPVYAQESTMNKSERYDSVQVPYSAFNVYSKNATVFKLDHEHVTNWELEIQNKLQYTNQEGNAVVRLYEDIHTPKFIEIGMGGPPDYRFWVAVNTPEDASPPDRPCTSRGAPSGTWGAACRRGCGYPPRAAPPHVPPRSQNGPPGCRQTRRFPRAAAGREPHANRS